MHRTRLKPKPPEADQPAPAKKAPERQPAADDDEYSRAPTLHDEGPVVGGDDEAEGELLD